MNNSLEIQVEFSYKGKDHVFSEAVDLDEIFKKCQTWPSFHEILAKNNDIDVHSYLFEVMEQADLVFVSATGLASEFLKNGHFDLEGFSGKWREERALDLLRPIALQELGMELDSIPGLKAAMLEAYRLGQSSKDVE